MIALSRLKNVLLIKAVSVTVILVMCTVFWYLAGQPDVPTCLENIASQFLK